MAKQRSNILKNLGKYYEVISSLIHAIQDMGGTDADFLNVRKHPIRIHAAAAAILGRDTCAFSFHSFMREGEPDQIWGAEMYHRTKSMDGEPCNEDRARQLMEKPSLVPIKYQGRFLVITGWTEPSGMIAVLYWRNGQLNQAWRRLTDYSWRAKGLVVRIHE